MSYEAAVAWSIVRSLLAGALCLEFARRTGPLARPDGPKGPSYFLLFVPFFMPGLVVGYAYRNASLSLVQENETQVLSHLSVPNDRRHRPDAPRDVQTQRCGVNDDYRSHRRVTAR